MAFRSIFDPDFKYRNSASTDVRKTFERIRREQRLEEQRRRDDDSLKVVVQIAGGQRVPAQRSQ